LVSAPVSSPTSGAQAIAAGGELTCALANGAVRCWGYNFYGQLGFGSTSDSHVPAAPIDFP